MSDLVVNGFAIPLSDVHVKFSKSSGPGGQNVNKRSTRAEISFDLANSAAIPADRRALAVRRLGGRVDARGRIRVVSSSARTQAANRELALARLEGLLADALRPPPRKRKRTRPSATATERRLSEKKARGKTKELRRKPALD